MRMSIACTIQFFVVTIVCLVLFGVPTAQAQSTAELEKLNETDASGVACKDAPFSTAAEREKVRQERPECYALRVKYGLIVPDSQGLQDISGLQGQDLTNAIQGLQTGLQLLQQLQSMSGQSGSPQGSPPPTQAPPAEEYPPQYQQYETRSQPTYGEGAAPSAYYPNSQYFKPATTAAPGTVAETPEERPSMPTEREAQTEDWFNTRTSEHFEWDEVRSRAAFEQSERDFVAPRKPGAAPTGLMARLFTKPAPGSGVSNPLSPNLFADFTGSFREAERNTHQFPAPATAPVDVVTAADHNPLITGVYSPLQNLLLGFANGIVSLFTRSSSPLSGQI